MQRTASTGELDHKYHFMVMSAAIVKEVANARGNFRKRHKPVAPPGPEFGACGWNPLRSCALRGDGIAASSLPREVCTNCTVQSGSKSPVLTPIVHARLGAASDEGPYLPFVKNHSGSSASAPTARPPGSGDAASDESACLAQGERVSTNSRTCVDGMEARRGAWRASLARPFHEKCRP
mmetsp:Transcript_65883/g.204083  ORF Transcript_65883/g.204083 Transcript_65883/m.204083 type:complete len:179 (-) Transcript_65883:5-541(-)